MSERQTQNNILKEKLYVESQGFYDITIFTDTEVGFSFWRNFENVPDRVSLFHLLIENKYWKDVNLKRKPILITAVYGKKTDNGVIMRQNPKSNEPLDLDFTNEYFYDIQTGDFYKRNRKIEGRKILHEVYEKHTRTTKPFRGFFLRAKLKFWKEWLPVLLSLIAEFFHYCLYLISGDKYTYKFLFQEENLNGEIISSRMDERIGRVKNQPEGKENEKEAKKFNLFGIVDVPQWPIVFYSVLHLFVWFVIQYFSFTTGEVDEFFNNSFLSILYVIASFWFLETVIPFVLKKLIKFFSSLAALSAYKKIHV